MTILTYKQTDRNLEPGWLKKKGLFYVCFPAVILAVSSTLNWQLIQQSQSPSTKEILTSTLVSVELVDVKIPKAITAPKDRKQNFAHSVSEVEQQTDDEFGQHEYVWELTDWLLQAISSEGTTTPDEIQDIYQVMQQIIEHGMAALPAIRQFLVTRKNFVFDGVENKGFVDYPNLRIAFIEALGEIGGQEAEEVLFEVLEYTADPAEVTTAARILEEQAPGYYNKSILKATRRALVVVAQGPLSDKTFSAAVAKDAALLFGMLKKISDETVTAEVERVLPWYKQYATVTLGSLSEDLGVPSLIRMSQSFTVPHNDRDRLTLHMLAQVAANSPNADEALLAKMRANEIPDALWPKITEVIGGDHQLQIESPEDSTEPIGSIWRQNPYSTQTIVGNQIQIIYSVHRSAVLSPEEIGKRSDLLNQMASETSNPIALRAINNTLSMLLEQ